MKQRSIIESEQQRINKNRISDKSNTGKNSTKNYCQYQN